MSTCKAVVFYMIIIIIIIVMLRACKAVVFYMIIIIIIIVMLRACTVVVVFLRSLSSSSLRSSIFSLSVWFSIFSCSKSIRCSLRRNEGISSSKRMSMCV